MSKQVIKGEDGKEYVLNEKKPIMKTPWFWTVIVIVILLIAGGFGYSAYQKNQAEERAAALKAKEDSFNDAEKEFYDYSYKVGTQLQKMDNKINKIWYNAIYNDSVTVKGQSYTDFNKAIAAQFDVWSGDRTSDKLDSNKSEVASYYKKMESDVTSSTNESFSNDKKTYHDLKSYYTLVTSPTGNYSTYSNNTTSANNKLGTDLQ